MKPALSAAHVRALGLLLERGSITTAELAEHDHRSRESARRLLHTLEQRRLTSAELVGDGCLRYSLAGDRAGDDARGLLQVVTRD